MSKVLYLPNQYAGSVRHYHHFLMGYYLPIFLDLDIDDDNYVLDCGDMNKIFEQTPKANFKFYNGSACLKISYRENPDSTYVLKSHRGFDGPRTTHIPKLKSIGDKINFIFDLSEQNTEDEYILLIDRGKTPEEKEIKFYNSLFKNEKSHILTYGNQRRTIINMDEVFECLNSIMPTKRVVLDNLDIKEQVSLFRGATYVVSQHGAGLSNLCFCSDKCKGFLEFINSSGPIKYAHNNEKRWFIGLAETMRLRHTQLPVTENHVRIDTDMLFHLVKFLLKD